MNISEIMTPNPVTVGQDDPMLAASKILKEKGFKHLPVVNGGGTLVGIITDRDLKRASASNATTLEIHELLYLLEKVKVVDIMTKSPYTVAADSNSGSAAKLMVEHKVGCLPVLDGARLVGILTKDDLLKLLIDG